MIDLRLYTSCQNFALGLLERRTCRESVAEIKEDGVELNDTEDQAQDVRLVHNGEPKGQNHAAEQDYGSDQELLLKDLVHVILRAVPERQPSQSCQNRNCKHDHESGRGQNYLEQVHQACEEHNSANSE